MRVCITGGAGFVGSHTVELLKKCNSSVLILDDFSTGRMKNITPFLSEHVRVENCDITLLPALLMAFKDFRPDAVIHLAAQSAITTSNENPVKDCCVNAIGTLNVLKAAREYHLTRFVFASTSAVYREKRSFWKQLKEHDCLCPESPYGISKLAAEFYIRNQFPSHVILRYANIYGPRQVPIGENQVIPRIIRHFKFGDKFYIHGSGNQERDFIYVEDVARANIDALYGTPGTYNIATGHSYSVNDIAGMLAKYYDIPRYKWEHTDKEDPRQSVCMDASFAREGLGWSFSTALPDGIAKTAEWWQGQKK